MKMESSYLVVVMILVVYFSSCTNTKQKEVSEEERQQYELLKGKALMEKSDCMSCHDPEIKKIGPSFQSIADKYVDSTENRDFLVQKVIKGGKGTWGPIAMSPHADLTEEEVNKMVSHILSYK